MCQGAFMQKDENQEWELFEDLAENTIQWESFSEKPRNSNLISSKGGLHSIELSIAKPNLFQRWPPFNRVVHSSRSKIANPMDNSIEWMPPLEEIGFEFLGFSKKYSHWMVILLQNPTFAHGFWFKNHVPR